MKKISLIVLITCFIGNVQAGFFDWLIPTAHAPNQEHSDLLGLGLSGKELRQALDNPSDVLEKFKQAKADVVYAELANAVYNGDENTGNWIILDHKNDWVTGFHAALYKNNETGQLVLAFEGTHILSVPDIVTDIQAIDKPTFQHAQAISYTKYLINKYGKNITLTGHSLGGGLAQFSAAAFGLKAITFNSAAVPHKGDALISLYKSYDPTKIRNYLLTGDIVNPGSKFLIKGKNYGKQIYIDIENPTWVEHKQGLMIDTLKSLGRAYDYLAEKESFDKNNLEDSRLNRQIAQNKLSSITQGNTSHFGSVDYYFNAANNVPTNTNRQRETVQENPYLAAGSRIVEAPADIVLNWGVRPADLDSHLTGPVDASGRERFHTFYANRGSLDTAPNALLYRDDTSHGVGRENLPEQTRINVTQPGIYNFYVHDYSNRHQTGSMEMSNSGAQVSLHSAGNRELPEGRNLGTKVAEYGIPTNREGTAWHVFELDTRRNVITPVNTLYNVSDPTKVPVK